MRLGGEPGHARREEIRLDGAGAGVEHHVVVEGVVRLVGDDGGALGDVGAQAAGVVGVMVGVDDVADGLVGDPPADLGDDRERARLVLGRLDDGDEVGELDGDAVVAAARDAPDAGGHLGGADDDGGNGRVLHVVGHRQGLGVHVGRRLRHRDLHRVVAGVDTRIALVRSG